MSRHNQPTFSWPTVGVVEAASVGLGFGVLSVGEADEWDFVIAKTCFLLACLVGGVQIVLLMRGRKSRMPYVVTFLACGLIGVLGVLLVNYVNHKREIRLPISQEKTAATNPPSIYHPFRPIWEANKHKLRSPLSGKQEAGSPHFYLAEHEYAYVIWEGRFFRLGIDGDNPSKWTRRPDPMDKARIRR